MLYVLLTNNFQLEHNSISHKLNFIAAEWIGISIVLFNIFLPFSLVFSVFCGFYVFVIIHFDYSFPLFSLENIEINLSDPIENTFFSFSSCVQFLRFSYFCAVWDEIRASVKRTNIFIIYIRSRRKEKKKKKETTFW